MPKKWLLIKMFKIVILDFIAALGSAIKIQTEADCDGCDSLNDCGCDSRDLIDQVRSNENLMVGNHFWRLSHKIIMSL